MHAINLIPAKKKSATHIVLGVNVGARLLQPLCNLRVAVLCCQHQRRKAILRTKRNQRNVKWKAIGQLRRGYQHFCALSPHAEDKLVDPLFTSLVFCRNWHLQSISSPTQVQMRDSPCPWRECRRQPAAATAPLPSGRHVLPASAPSSHPAHQKKAEKHEMEGDRTAKARLPTPLCTSSACPGQTRNSTFHFFGFLSQWHLTMHAMNLIPDARKKARLTLFLA